MYDQESYGEGFRAGFASGFVIGAIAGFMSALAIFAYIGYTNP